jgi:hypothetical protein
MPITINDLEKRMAALEARLEALEAEPKAVTKPKKTKAAADAEDGEPKAKKEANWFVKALAGVRVTLKPLIEAHNSALPEGGKKLAGTVAPQVGRMLKEAGHLAEALTPTEAQVKAAFASFLASPPTPKPASVASEGSKAGKAKKPKAELSEEEAAALKAQKAAKAAATRAANKAKKAVVEGFADMPKAPADDDDAPLEAYLWTGDIGKGPKEYERIDYNGTAYIYTTDGETFIGEWNGATKKLKSDGYDIKNM